MKAAKDITYIYTAVFMSIAFQCVDCGPESVLINQVLDSYDVRERPVSDPSDAVNVHIGIALNHILVLNEKRQTVTVNLWMRQYWNDHRLRWTPSDHGGLQSIVLPWGLHWKPDIVLYNNADKTFEPTYEDIMTSVTSDGDVSVMYPIVYDLSCEIVIHYFPFDQQDCLMKFGSWVYSNDGLLLRMREEIPIDISNYHSNSGWGLVRVASSEHNETYGCCSKPYSDVRFHFVLRRQWTMLFFHLLLPCLICNVLVVAQFILPCDSGEKVTLSITLFLSMVVYLLLLQEMLPNTSDLPVLIYYMTWTLILVCISMAVTVVVLHLHHNGTHDNHMQLPSWARELFLHRLSKFVFLHKYITSDDEHKIKMTSYKSSVSLIGKEGSSSESDGDVEMASVTNWSRETDFKKKDERGMDRGLKLDQTKDSGRELSSSAKSKSRHARKVDVRVEKLLLDVDTANIKSIPSIKSSMFRRRSTLTGSKTLLHRDDLAKYKNMMLYKILKHCEEFKERRTEVGKDRELQCEWMQLAMVIDRLMLIVCLFITVVILMYLFLSKPAYSDPIIA